MDAKYLAIGGLGLLGVLVLRDDKSKKGSKKKSKKKSKKRRILDSVQVGSKAKSPSFCITGDLDAKDTEVLMSAFNKAWAASGHSEGEVTTIFEIPLKAHNLVQRVLADVCPNLPGSFLENVDAVKKRQPRGYTVVYDTVYDWASQRLTGA